MAQQVKVVSTGQVVTLGRELGRGTNAIVYEGPHPDQAMKLLNGTTPDPDWVDLVEHQISHPIAGSKDVTFALPVSTVLDPKSGEIGGFVMRRGAPDGIDLDVLFLSSSLLPAQFLLRVSKNLVLAYGALHQAGYVKCDGINALVHQDASLTMVDTDGYFAASLGFQPPQCKLGFQSPEFLAQGDSGDSFVPTFEHDCHVLSVELFKLLARPCDSFPHSGQFRGQGKRPSLKQRIKKGIFPPSGNWPDWNPLPEIQFHSLPQDCQHLFVTTFEADDPRLRPSLDKWRRILEKYDTASDVTLRDTDWDMVRSGCAKRKLQTKHGAKNTPHPVFAGASGSPSHAMPRYAALTGGLISIATCALILLVVILPLRAVKNPLPTSKNEARHAPTGDHAPTQITELERAPTQRSVFTRNQESPRENANSFGERFSHTESFSERKRRSDALRTLSKGGFVRSH